MSEHIYRRGVTTLPDVQKLLTAFEDRKPGDICLYEEIVAIIGCNRDTDRFKTIIGRWRRILFQSRNLLLCVQVNRGYKIATNPERVVSSLSKARQGLKRIRYGGEIATTTADDDLDDNQRRSRDAVTMIAARVAGVVEQTRKGQINWGFSKSS